MVACSFALPASSPALSRWFIRPPRLSLPVPLPSEHVRFAALPFFLRGSCLLPCEEYIPSTRPRSAPSITLFLAPGETFTFTNSRGEALFARYVTPKGGNGKAVVVHLHGLGEHCCTKACFPDQYSPRLLILKRPKAVLRILQSSRRPAFTSLATITLGMGKRRMAQIASASLSTGGFPLSHKINQTSEFSSHLVDDAIHFLLKGVAAEKYDHLSELPFFISGANHIK